MWPAGRAAVPLPQRPARFGASREQSARDLSCAMARRRQQETSAASAAAYETALVRPFVSRLPPIPAPEFLSQKWDYADPAPCDNVLGVAMSG